MESSLRSKQNNFRPLWMTCLWCAATHLRKNKLQERWDHPIQLFLWSFTFIFRMLPPPQKAQRGECSRAFLDLFNRENVGVLSRVVTGDETLVHHYEPESTWDYLQLHKGGTTLPTEFKQSQSVWKLIATNFLRSVGILVID